MCNLDWKAASEPLRSATSWTSEHAKRGAYYSYYKKRYTHVTLYMCLNICSGLHWDIKTKVSDLYMDWRLRVKGIRLLPLLLDLVRLSRWSFVHLFRVGRCQGGRRTPNIMMQGLRTFGRAWQQRNMSHPGALEVETTMDHGEQPASLWHSLFLEIGTLT